MEPHDGLVRRTVRVMRAVASNPEGVGLTEVSRLTGLSKATALRILGDLVSEGWVAANGETHKYRVSLGMLDVVGRLLDGDSAFENLRRALRNLSDETQETAGFDLLVRPHVVVVAQEAGPQLISQAIRPVPRSQPVWITATGRVFLAYEDRVTIPKVYGATFPATSARERTQGIKDFIDQLDVVREHGYALVRNELEDGASAIGAPVFNDGRVAYALWIGGPSFRFTDQRVPELAAQALRTARELSALVQVGEIQFATR